MLFFIEKDYFTEYIFIRCFIYSGITETHISFDVQKNCYVTLKVYDFLRRQVSTLVNQNMNEGHYIVQFNGKGLSSGIYLYRIEMRNYSKTKKMLLSK